MFVIAVILLFSLSITAVWTAIHRAIQASAFVKDYSTPSVLPFIDNFFIQYLIPFALGFLVLFVLYKFIPETKVHTRGGRRGARSSGAVLWEIFKRIFVFYVGQFLGRRHGHVQDRGRDADLDHLLPAVDLVLAGHPALGRRAASAVVTTSSHRRSMRASRPGILGEELNVGCGWPAMKITVQGARGAAGLPLRRRRRHGDHGRRRARESRAAAISSSSPQAKFLPAPGSDPRLGGHPGPGRSPTRRLAVRLRSGRSPRGRSSGRPKSSIRPCFPLPASIPPPSIDPSARLGEGVSIGPLCVVGDGVEIGDGTVLYPSTSPSIPASVIGADCVLHSGVHLREGVRLGARVILHNGVVIGGDGFGYLQSRGRHARSRSPSSGRSSSRTTSRSGPTRRSTGPPWGRRSSAAGPRSTTWSSSPTTSRSARTPSWWPSAGSPAAPRSGAGAILSGQVGVPDHVTIGDGAIVAAKTGVTGNVPAGAFVSGSPHLDILVWRKFWAAAPRLYELVKEFKRLQARVDALEKKE